MKALIIDDSRAMRRILTKIVAPLGFEVIEAENGQEGFDRLQEAGDVEIILVDWNMPVMSGIDFLTHLRQRDGGDKPKVVFCTTENDVEHIREAINAGADEYVMKPFDHETLQIKLQLVGFA